MVESVLRYSLGLAAVASFLVGAGVAEAAPLGCAPDETRSQQVGNAQFTVVAAAGTRAVSYDSATNLVFCRDNSATMIWIRLARDSVEDGERGPHLDIDLCNAASGQMGPMPARAQPCPGGPTWALWWHDAEGDVFANGPDSSSCALALEMTEAGLRGKFECRRLENAAGTATIDIVDGAFECEYGESFAPTGGADRDPRSGRHEPWRQAGRSPTRRRLP